MSTPSGGSRPPDEAHAAIEAFSDEDWERFRSAASYQLYRFAQLDPDDLVNETACRFIDGRRSWPLNEPDIRPVFYNALRSIADEWRTAEMSDEVLLESELTREAAEGSSPLNEMATDERTPAAAAEAGQLVSQVFDEFKGDQDVEAVIYGRMFGMTADEVQAEFAISSAEFDAARKRFERWLRAQESSE